MTLRKQAFDPSASKLLSVGWIELPIRIEEANDALWLLERLNQSVQQDAVKATIVPTNAVLVVLVEGVHACPPLTQYQQGTPVYWRCSMLPRAEGISRAEPLAS